MGSLLGELKDLSAHQLGSIAIKAALERASLAGDQIDEVYMGCVLPAGQGQAPARQASLGAGIPDSVPCTTVNKVCGSGMKTVMLAHDSLLLDSGNIIVAGGMESMTNAPHLMLKARSGYRLGSDVVYDHMALDGLQDAYEKGVPMGNFGERCVKQYGFSRQQQDDFAIASLTRAKKASNDGTFAKEIAPVTVKSKKGDVVISLDEQAQKSDPAKIPTLKPAFGADGTITAATASSISDGAAALVLMRLSQAEKRGLTPLAKILGHASYAQAPSWYTTAPIFAMRRLSEKTGIAVSEFDLFEINEAFAVVPMAAMHDLKLPHEKVNIHGGACALGHPIGASGARLLVTLLNALQTHGLKRGMASLCIGGGEAVATAIERMN
jgi:acetyl-CoA C-acetyltransferase